jgi:hypothetical protein
VSSCIEWKFGYGGGNIHGRSVMSVIDFSPQKPGNSVYTYHPLTDIHSSFVKNTESPSPPTLNGRPPPETERPGFSDSHSRSVRD